MNKQEAAVIGAYTGVLMGEFKDLHTYIEKILGHEVYTSQLANEELAEKIKNKSKPDFLALADSLED